MRCAYLVALVVANTSLSACAEDSTPEGNADSTSSSETGTAQDDGVAMTDDADDGTSEDGQAGSGTSTGAAEAGADSESGELGCSDPATTGTTVLIELDAADGKGIAGSVTHPDGGACLPAVVLLHQFNSNKEQWDAQIEAFTVRGYVTLAIDLRGHGDSDAQDGALADILTDPDQAPLDVAAAVAYLVDDATVDAERIGVVGTSIGANLAVVAATQQPEVKVAVPISTRLDPVEALLGGAPISLGPVLCYAGETDGGGDHAMTCAALEPLSSGPATSVILPGTSAHGVAIVQDFPETMPAVLDFLDANL